MEHWTAKVRWLCKACSEGRPHEAHDHDLPDREWFPERTVAFSALSEGVIREVLERWIRQDGCEVRVLTCELNRTQA